MNTDLESLLYDSSRVVMDQNAGLACKNPAMIRDLLDLTYKQKVKYSPRASRVLFFVANTDSRLLDAYINEIIRFLPAIRNSSIKMNLTNLLYRVDLQKHQQHLGLLVDQCFKWLNSPSETAATKVYSMEILYKIVQFIPELKEELVSTIEDQVIKGSAGIKVRGVEVLNRL